MSFRIDVYHHGADELRAILQRIEEKIGVLMANLDEVLVLVTAETTKLDSIITLIDGLKQQLADALSGVTLPPAVQAKVDEIFANATTNAAKISDALDENVPTG